jgi:hypothetical protein
MLSGATMEANAIETLFIPYTRFAQASAELLKNLPQAASIVPQAYTSVQGSASTRPDPAAPSPSAYADLALQWMTNWMTFWVSLSQAMLTLSTQGQEAWLDQAREGTRATAGLNKAAQEPARRTRSAH